MRISMHSSSMRTTSLLTVSGGGLHPMVGGLHSGVGRSTYPREQNETGVKTLPCPK